MRPIFPRMCRCHTAVHQQICLLFLKVNLQCPSLLLQACVSELLIRDLTGTCLVKVKLWKGTNGVQKTISHRTGCSAAEYEALVQRTKAANSGVTSGALRDLWHLSWNCIR